jgi:hypothetical protein
MFTMATLAAKPLLTWIGPKLLCLISMLLGSFGCLLIGNPSLSYNTEVVVPKEVIDKLQVLALSMNGNFAGYLLICVSAAFIAAASFEEVMTSTE